MAKRMQRDDFITRPMSLWLDLVRGLAALAVVFGHAVRLGVYTGPFPFSRALEKNAVVVFFVLSGLVIATSVAKRSDTLTSYAIARASRIVPVTLGAVLVAVAVAALDMHTGAAPRFAAHRGWADPIEVLQAVLFLSESYNTNFALNPAHWSLCYEVWFYALFAAAHYLRGKTRVVWLILLGAAAGPNPLLMLPTWLIGVWIARDSAAWTTDRDKGLIYVAVALAALFIVPGAAPTVLGALKTVIPWNPGYSLYALSDFALGLAVAIGFIGLRALSAEGVVVPAGCEKSVRFLANCSFSLYLLHWPLLKLALILGISAGDSGAGFLAIVAGVVAISAAFAAVTEHKRYAVRQLLEKLLRQPRVSASAPVLPPSTGAAPR